jgi:glucuronate isomerase
LFPVDPHSRGIARELYQTVADKPIISPHGHTDPRWYAENQPFPDPAQLFITPDHYVFRMLFSQGVSSKVSACRGSMAAHRNRRPQDLAAVCRELSPVPRHAFAAAGSTMRSRMCSA